MSYLEENVEIANPQHPHVATILVLDVSGSMSVNDKITELNDGLTAFKHDVLTDDLACKRVELAIVTFGQEVQVTQEFTSIEGFEPPALEANGKTPMGQAILQAIDLSEQRKDEYKSQGIDYYRPWIFLITDGWPTDMRPGDAMWNDVIRAVHEGEQNGKFLFFAVGVDEADMDVLKEVAPPNRPPIKLAQGKFHEMFMWLSKSQQAVSSSKVGEQTSLASPAGWADVTV